MNTNTQRTTPTPTPIHHLFLDVAGVGGEVVIGTIPAPVYDYWSDAGSGTLNKHLFQDHRGIEETRQGKIIDPDFANESWHENDSEMHVFGSELSYGTTLSVSDETRGLLCNLDVSDPIFRKQMNWMPAPKLKPGERYFRARTYESVVTRYTFSSSESFCATKLRINLATWADSHIVDSICYDGVDLEPGLIQAEHVRRPIAQVF